MYENLVVEPEETNTDPYMDEFFKNHSNKTNRRLHVIGVGLALLIVIHSVFTFDIFQLLWAPVFGFGFAWVGHFFFQLNKPAMNASQIIYSLKATLILILSIITRKRSF